LKVIFCVVGNLRQLLVGRELCQEKRRVSADLGTTLRRKLYANSLVQLYLFFVGDFDDYTEPLGRDVLSPTALAADH
jgi:hypothetical protein